MSTYYQLPGELNIEISADDDLALPIDFSISLVDYTFDANVIKFSDGSETAIIVSGTSLVSGTIQIFLTETDIGNLEVGTHKWYLTWTTEGISRRALAGRFEIKKYP